MTTRPDPRGSTGGLLAPTPDVNVSWFDESRTRACVRFCQEVHSETLERLREKSIGALTLLAFLDKYEWVESDIGELVCLHCDGVRPYHTPECLLNTILEVYRAYET